MRYCKPQIFTENTFESKTWSKFLIELMTGSPFYKRDGIDEWLAHVFTLSTTAASHIGPRPPPVRLRCLRGTQLLQTGQPIKSHKRGPKLPRIMTRESVSLCRPVVWGKLETKNPISINIPLLEIPFFAST